MRIFDIVTDRAQTQTQTETNTHTHTHTHTQRDIGNDPGDRKLWVAAPEGGKKSQKSSISGFV